MKLNVMFIIAAVYGFVTGLPLILAPEAMASMAGIQAPAGLLMGYRFLGVAELGLGIIAWLVRNAEASKTRDGVALGFTFTLPCILWQAGTASLQTLLPLSTGSWQACRV